MLAFRNLVAWREAHAFTLAVYQTTGAFPQRERFHLTDQLRRSAASVATNLAEGCGRDSAADFGRFVQIALGSAAESEYLLLLAHDLGYISQPQHIALENDVRRLTGLLIRLRRRLRASTPV